MAAYNQIDKIGQQLRMVREGKGISQVKLGKLTGLSQNQISYLETGSRTPTMKAVLKVCEALEIEPAHFVQIIWFPQKTQAL